MQVDLRSEVNCGCIRFLAVALVMAEVRNARADRAIESNCYPDEVESQGKSEDNEQAHEGA